MGVPDNAASVIPWRILVTLPQMLGVNLFVSIINDRSHVFLHYSRAKATRGRDKMDTLIMPPDQRFEKQISRWFDLTALFPRQLHELDKGEYLANKRREHSNQLLLQMEAGQ
jgi:hypothetical protein